MKKKFFQSALVKAAMMMLVMAVVINPTVVLAGNDYGSDGHGHGTSILIAPSALTDGVVGVLYSQILTVSPCDTGPFAWQILSGTLPAGLSFNTTSTTTTAALTGTPTATGTFPFSVKFTTAGHNSATKAYSLAILEAVTPTITITPISLPDGSLSVPYTQTLSLSTTSAGPVTWSVDSGTLPAGLVLGTSTTTSDTISGIPTSAAAASFTIRATDGTNSATQAYSINITAPVPSTSFSNGFVSLTFDDGYLSQFTNAKPALDSGGVKGTFYIVSHAISGLSIINPSLEYSLISSSTPDGWVHNDRASSTYIYLLTGGHTGQRAAEVSSTITGSNAAWSFTPVTVLPDKVYDFTEYYQSTATSSLQAQVTLTDGSTIFADVTDANGATLGSSVALGSTAGAWQQVQTHFYLPVNAVAVTVMNSLQDIGTLAIDDATLGLSDRMDISQVLALQADGQEIGGHTQTHPDLTLLPVDVVTTEISGGRLDLLTSGLTPADPFNYPFGAFNPVVQQITQTAGFTSARTVTSGFNELNTPKFALLAQSVDASTTLAQVKAWIDQAKADKTWLILIFHQIVSDTTGLPNASTPTNLQDIISYLSLQGVPAKTVTAGIAMMETAVVPVLPEHTTTPDSVTITWTTSLPETSRVIYDTVSHSNASTTSALAPNYGYAFSTVEDSATTTSHSVLVSRLTAGTTYYFRPVSHGSPEIVGSEIAVTTLSSAPVTSSDTSGSTGGGGGYISAPLQTISTASEATTPANPDNSGIKEVLGVKINAYSNLYGLDSNTVEAASLDEATTIYNFNGAPNMTDENMALYNKLVKNYTGTITSGMKNSIQYFIQTGSNSTRRLGSGERTGVLGSFMTAFGTLPQSIADWQDVIKIANGRWPKNRNAKIEMNMQTKYFMTIYNRSLNSNDAHDTAANSIFTYGLRPVMRNLQSEANATRTFKAIFKHLPISATDWDVIRGIAYSGAKR